MARLGLFLAFTTLAVSGCDGARPGLLDPTHGAGRDLGPGSGEPGDPGTINDTGGGDNGPPAAGTPGFCGNDILTALEDPPNLYFVLDRSGSMSDPIDPDDPLSEPKLDASRGAIETVLQAVGHRVQYGAAVFPSDGGDGCNAGHETFPTQRGDSVAAAAGQSGVILTRLMNTLAGYPPSGGTPAGATLRVLSEPLSRLEGTSYVLLFTDGGPNCNYQAACTSNSCIPDIERVRLQSGEVCGIDLLCCSDEDFSDARAGCIDESTVHAIADLEASGVSTYVIGLPGADPYADVLNRMAVAGGRARVGNAAEAYYAVDSTPDLVETLSAITLNLALSCEIELSAAPPDANDVNVYFDDDVVKSDDENGWSYTGESTIQLHGEACETLMSGAVRKVQIVAGCPTVVR